MQIATYILTCNAPLQLEYLLKSFYINNTELIDSTDIIIADQSTTTEFNIANYNIICKFNNKHQHLKLKNLGCSGGRHQVAQLFNQSSYDYMFFFEDDMTISYNRERCRFGFTSHLQNIVQNVKNIIEIEKLDYIKLSFHEVFNDHSKIFPSNESTIFYKLNCLDIPYLVGEIYFSNWPMLISQSGNNKIFNFDIITMEADLAVKSINLIRNKELRAAVLCAYPIHHHRIQNIIDHQR